MEVFFLVSFTVVDSLLERSFVVCARGWRSELMKTNNEERRAGRSYNQDRNKVLKGRV